LLYGSYIINELYRLHRMSKNTLKYSAQSVRDLSIPEGINSPNAKLIYVYLKSVKSATIDQLCSSLGLKKLTAFPIISSLRKSGFIEKLDDIYKPTK